MSAVEEKKSSSVCVEGQKYQARLLQETWNGAVSHTSKLRTHIFIPSYRLDIREDGTVAQMEERNLTAAASEDLDLLVRLSRTAISQSKIQEVIRKSDETAVTLIQIKKDVIDQIKALYERSIAGDTPQGQVPLLKHEIAQIVQKAQLF